MLNTQLIKRVHLLQLSLFTSSTPPRHPPPPTALPPRPLLHLPPSPPFPANNSSITLPNSPKPHYLSPNSSPPPSTPSSPPYSPKLIATSVCSILATLLLLLIVLFLHKKRTKTSSNSSDTKTTRSDTNSYFNNNQTRIPKLTRPSQTSSEFLYLGTLVNSHIPQNASSNALNPRKMDSSELHPLPHLLNRQQMTSGLQNVELETKEFYSPRGSGRESSIGVISGDLDFIRWFSARWQGGGRRWRRRGGGGEE